MNSLIHTLAELTAQHHEVAVELLDHQRRIRVILFDGMTHPECLPTGGSRAQLEGEDAFQAIELANVYPRELYENATLAACEPIATEIPLEEAIALLRED